MSSCFNTCSQLLSNYLHPYFMMVYIMSFITIITITLQSGLYGVHSSSIVLSFLLIISLVMVSGIPPSVVLLIKLSSILTYAIGFKLLLLLYLFYMMVFLLTMSYFIRLLIMALFTNSLLLTKIWMLGYQSLVFTILLLRAVSNLTPLFPLLPPSFPE